MEYLDRRGRSAPWRMASPPASRERAIHWRARKRGETVRAVDDAGGISAIPMVTRNGSVSSPKEASGAQKAQEPIGQGGGSPGLPPDHPLKEREGGPYGQTEPGAGGCGIEE